MPKYEVQIPNGPIYDVEAPDGVSEDQVIQQVAQEHYRSTPYQPDFTVGEMAQRGIMRGIKRIGVDYGDVLPAMVGSAFGAEDYAKAQMQEAAETQKEINMFYSPQYESRKDVKGIGDALGYALETVTEQVGNIGTIIGTGGIGGATAKVATKQAIKKGAEKFAKMNADELAEQIIKSQQRGQNVGVFLGSYSLNAPEVFQNIYEQTGKLEPAAASIAGIINALLDSVFPATILRNLSQPGRAGVVEQVLIRSGMQPTVARKAARNIFTKIGSGVTTEGLTESAQEAVSIAAEKLVADTASVWDSEDFDRIIESGVRGAIAGGAFRGLSAPIERYQEKRLERQTETTPEEGNKKEIQTTFDGDMEPEGFVTPGVLSLTPQRLREAGFKTMSPEYKRIAKDLSPGDSIADLSDPEVYNYVKGLTKLGLGEDGKPITKNKKGKPLPEAEIRRNKETRQAAINLLKGVTEPTSTTEVITDEQQDTTDTKGPRTAESLPEFTGEGIALPGQPGIGVSPRVGQSIGTGVDSNTNTVKPLDGGKGDVNSALKGREEVLDTTRPIEERAIIIANRIQAVDPGNEFIDTLREGIVTEEDIAAAQTTLEEIQATTPKPVQEEVQEVKEEVQEVPDVTEENYDSISSAFEQTEQEQKLREELLSDADRLFELAQDENMEVEDLLQIIQQNYDKLKPYAKKLKQKINSKQYKTITNKRRQQAKKVNPQVANQAIESNTPDIVVEQAAQDVTPESDVVEDQDISGPDTVDEAKYKKIIESAGAAIRGSTPFNNKIAEWFARQFSKLPGWSRSLYLRFLSLPQQIELYGDKLPGLKTLLNNLQRRATLHDEYRRSIEKLVLKGKKITEKYDPATIKKWNETVLKLSIENIDPRRVNTDLEVKDNQYYKDFIKLPKELQDLAIEYTEMYEEFGRQLLYFLEQRVPAAPGQQKTISKLSKDFEKHKLKFYHPLLRRGEFWLRYDEVGKDGEKTPVVKAFENPRERLQAIEKLKGRKDIDVDSIDISTRPRAGGNVSIPDSALMNSIMNGIEGYGKNSNLTDEQIKELQEQIYETYLDMFPSESIRQQSRKREGYPGYIEDVVFAFGDTASRMINQLTNLEYRPEIGSALEDIRLQAERSKDDNLVMVSNNVNSPEQTKFYMNPTANRFAAAAGYMSYLWYIGGNVSSALVNLTQVPGVALPMLGGDFGNAKAAKAVEKATAMFLRGSFDNNREYWPDWTMYAGKDFDQTKYGRLFERLLETATVRRGAGFETSQLEEGIKTDESGLLGKFSQSKVNAWLGWTFQNSERANREITAVAAYDLALDKGMSREDAIQYAIDLTVKVHSHALPEAGPQIFQDNFGKVAFTFKRFAQAQIYIESRLFLQAMNMTQASPEEKSIARKQLLGIYGMMFMLAGAQGMPLYGAANLLATMLYDDDDVPYDFDEAVRSAIGDLGYKGPLNKILNVDIASRTGFNGLLWREDPRRLAEVGFPQYFVEHFFGPGWSIVVNAGRGLNDFSQGNIMRGFENTTPSFVRNIFKSMRVATEGARTRQGTKIIDDPGAYSAFMQIIGFNNAELAEAYARANSMKQAEKKIMNRKTSLLNKYWLAMNAGDTDGMIEAQRDLQILGIKYPGLINSSTITRSMKQKQRREREAIDGISLPNKIRNQIINEYGS